MQFKLSDWFTRSRLPVIIPGFDLIWKLMRQMSLSINFFSVKPSFLDKEMDEKGRFGELSMQ